MLGGIMGEHREILSGDDPHSQFEQACERQFGEAIRADQSVGVELWSALANIIWEFPERWRVAYSFRSAGDLVAALRREGDYLDWYCSGPQEIVSERIRQGLAAEGWIPKRYDEIPDGGEVDGEIGEEAA